ncbi:MAG: hypothetical protein LWY06_03035 [Firmicutes bacterium]|nr:hypothetical protein [Bacillota bacterium]
MQDKDGEAYKMPDENQAPPASEQNPAGIVKADAQTPVSAELINNERNKMEFERSFKSGASWFFWIAGLSLINSIIILSKGKISFIFGLGITQILDALGQHFGGVGAIITMVLNLIVIGVFIVIGILCHKRYFWAFWVGMVLYGIDGLIFLLGMDILSIVFHAFALISIYWGLQSLKKLEELEARTKDTQQEAPVVTNS